MYERHVKISINEKELKSLNRDGQNNISFLIS